MQAGVILAGGLGTRLRPLTDELPKPMIRVNGRPFLEYEIELLKRSGVERFVLCVGYLGEKIEEHFGDGGRFGVSIAYSNDGEKLLGPAGALKKAEPLLGDKFFVTYADAYLMLNYREVMKQFVASGKLGMMVVYGNRNRYGKSDVIVKDGYVPEYNKRVQKPSMVWINFGVSLSRKETHDLIPSGRELGKQEFCVELIKRTKLAAYVTRERFYEIGTPLGLHEFEEILGGRQVATS